MKHEWNCKRLTNGHCPKEAYLSQWRKDHKIPGFEGIAHFSFLLTTKFQPPGKNESDEKMNEQTNQTATKEWQTYKKNPSGIFYYYWIELYSLNL